MSGNHQKIGYARVSTHEQNLDCQIDALTQAGCLDIYSEKISGKNAERPELQQCLRILRPGDTLIVWRLDRLARSLSDLVHLIAMLGERNIVFESLQDKIDTSHAAGKLTFHVFAALAEFERNLVRERTYAGLAAARARGRQGGRKPSLEAQQIKEIRALLREPNIRAIDVAKRYPISRSTLYKHRGAILPTRK
jgi:DNA invertase Pin-like site-specific DNA recombinase